MLLTQLLMSYLKICYYHGEQKSTICKNSCKSLNDYPKIFFNPKCTFNPDVMLDTLGRIRRYNYTAESHQVLTPDGYILVLFRIPPKEEDHRRRKQPVFLQYGIASDSSGWTSLGHNSLAFLLADEGYDVWFGNLRESKYSRQHKTLKDSNKQYWNYTIDDVMKNDIKSSLEKVSEITGKSKSIIYIGHSKGAALALMFASEYPEKAEELLRGIIAICPAVYFDIEEKHSTFIKTLHSRGISVLFRDANDTRLFFMTLCTMVPRVCIDMISGAAGNFSGFPPENFLLLFSNFPSAVPIKELVHLNQIAKSKTFQKFDFGEEENLRKYGQKRPPIYDLGSVKVPVFLFYGKNDKLIGEENLKRILSELGSTNKYLYSVPINDNTEEHQFNHMEFTISNLSKELFYDDLIGLLKEQLVALEAH